MLVLEFSNSLEYNGVEILDALLTKEERMTAAVQYAIPSTEPTIIVQTGIDKVKTKLPIIG